ncbi:unnamed protein product [Rhizoctonia solani]|uniref:DUF3224 domain-containing protein n=1 Tax=Rhizoctonia solani TaxID=456999 RepID=A0A8H3HRS2_9AGAM|nr:unnamed protein product [Rhizoctonia solani]CAE6530146.1 unnamed protein product [Rhizoctonia solani]
MSAKSIKALYHTVNWEEKPVSEEGAPLKITRVRTERTFSGAMTGTGIAEYTICYHADGSCAEGTCSGMPTSSYTGICHFKGSIDGSPEGEVIFIVENGKFTGAAEADWIIDEKTAIGGLKGLKGKGGYKHDATAKFEDGTNVWFEYTL